ncbi:hypothetical protein HDU76_010446, partial [Blyttiomyces sp. JEL0837]
MSEQQTDSQHTPDQDMPQRRGSNTLDPSISPLEYAHPTDTPYQGISRAGSVLSLDRDQEALPLPHSSSSSIGSKRRRSEHGESSSRTGEGAGSAGVSVNVSEIASSHAAASQSKISERERRRLVMPMETRQQKTAPFEVKQLSEVLKSVGYEGDKDVEWTPRQLSGESGLERLQEDFNLNYVISKENQNEAETSLLNDFQRRMNDLSNNQGTNSYLSQEFEGLEQTEATIQADYSFVIRRMLIGPSDDFGWTMGVSPRVPKSCLPGNADGQPDILCVSKHSVGTYLNNKNSELLVPLICGEFKGLTRAGLAVPQVVWAAMVAVLTMLALGIPPEEIAVPLFTAAVHQFRFYALTVVTDHVLEFRLHPLDGFQVREFQKAISPIDETQKIISFFEVFRLHAIKMSTRIKAVDFALKAAADPEEDDLSPDRTVMVPDTDLITSFEQYRNDVNEEDKHLRQQ